MWKKRYLKYKELLRRKVCAIPHRVYAFALLLSCMIGTLFCLQENLHMVYVTDSDGACRLVTTHHTESEALLELADMHAENYDRISYTSYADNLSNLNVQRAFPVTVEADGVVYTDNIVEGTVEEVLAHLGIQMGEHDYTVPSLNSEVQQGAEIQVNRVDYVDTVTYEDIPYETVHSYTSEFYKKRGRTVVRQKGQVGQKAITNRERWVNGELESSQMIATQITKQPKDEIIRSYRAGAPVSPRLGPDGTTNPPSSYKTMYNGKATGYHSKSGGRGSAGLGLSYGTVAVDPRKIPYGSLLYIASPDGKFVYGYAIATDTGTALQEGHVLVDLYYETEQEALLNGAQTVNVYVVK